MNNIPTSYISSCIITVVGEYVDETTCEQVTYVSSEELSQIVIPVCRAFRDFCNTGNSCKIEWNNDMAECAQIHYNAPSIAIMKFNLMFTPDDSRLRYITSVTYVPKMTTVTLL